MRPQIFLLLILLCPACTVKPMIITLGASPTKPERKITSLGGSFLTKAKTERAKITLPDGTILEHEITGKNETSVPNAYIAGQVTEALGEMAAGVSNTATAADVSKAQISATQAVEIQQSKAAVEISKHAVEAEPAP